jgi:hypothetical protein
VEEPELDRRPTRRQAFVAGKTEERDYDLECALIESRPTLAVLVTRSEPVHRIEIRPRYVGGELGRPSAPGTGTIAYFHFDGRDAALCTYWELAKGALIVPQDYTPTLSAEEAADVSARVAARRRQLE